METSTQRIIEAKTARPTAELRQVELAPERKDRLRENARILWGHRRLLFRVSVIAFAVSLGIAFLLPKEYSSSTELMPPDVQRNSSLSMMLRMAAGSESNLAGLVMGSSTTGDLFIEILRSRTVGERLVTKFDLQKVYGSRLMGDARKALMNRTVITLDKKSGAITIAVSDTDPRRARALAAEYIEQLDRVLVESNTSSAHRERVFLEERLVLIKQELEATEKEFSEFASKNIAIDIPQQGKAMVEAAATLQGQMIAAESELSGVKQIYTENNVRVRALRAKVAELRRQLEKVGGADEGGKGAEDDKSIYPPIRKLPLLGVRYADLYRQIKIQETVMEVLTRQYELAKVEEAKELPSVRVLDPAEFPERKTWPPRLSIGVLGALLGLLSGMSWILGNARLQELDSDDWRRTFVTEASVRLSIAREKAFARVARSNLNLLGRFRRKHDSGQEKLQDQQTP